MYHPTDNYWTQIIAYYKQLPNCLSVKEKWEQAYVYMRVKYPTSLPEIPTDGNVYVREYAMAVHAMTVYRFSSLALADDFIQRWRNES